MRKNNIAIIESKGLLDTLKAVDIMTSRQKVKLIGRYFLGRGNVAAVVEGPAKEISVAISLIEKQSDHLDVRAGIIPDVSQSVLDVMLKERLRGRAPLPVKRRKEPPVPKERKTSPPPTPKRKERTAPAPDKEKVIPSACDLEEVQPKKGPAGKRVSFEDVSGLSGKRKKRFRRIMDYFIANKDRRVTAKEVRKALPDISKGALGRDLSYLAKHSLILKKGRGRGTFYLYPPDGS